AGFTQLFPAPPSHRKPRQTAKLALSLIVTALILSGGAGYLLLNKQVEQHRQRIRTAADGDRYGDALDALRDMHVIQRWWLEPESEQRSLADQGLRRVESLTADGDLRRALTLCDQLKSEFESVPGIDLGHPCDQQRSRIRSRLLEEFDQRLERDAYKESLDYVQTQTDLLIKFETNLPLELRERIKRRGLATADDTLDPAQSYRLLKDTLLSLFPNDAEVIRMLWESELQTAKSLNAQSKYTEAIQLCLAAESRGAPARSLLEPLCTAYNGRAMANTWPDSQSDFQLALDQLDQYRDHPLWARTLLNRAAARLETEPLQSVCDCARILDQHPGHPAAIQRLNEVFVQSQESAINVYRTLRAQSARAEQRVALARTTGAGILAWELIQLSATDSQPHAPLELYFIRATLRWESPQPNVDGSIADFERVANLAAERQLKSLAALARLRVAWIQTTHVHFGNRRPDVKIIESILTDIEGDYYLVIDDKIGDRDFGWLDTLFVVAPPSPKDREYQLGIFLSDTMRTHAAILGQNRQFEPAVQTIGSALGQLKTLDQHEETSLTHRIEDLQQQLQNELQSYTQQQPIIDSRPIAPTSHPCPDRKQGTADPVETTDDPSPNS
ncbi:MAG: hypothetical protein ABGZ17_00030, partial [Planctomycetaceae bacterium]